MLSDKFSLSPDDYHADSFERKERQDSINRFLDQASLTKTKELLGLLFMLRGQSLVPPPPAITTANALDFTSFSF